MKTLTIHWRSEGYGQHSGKQAAFRLYDLATLSDTAVRRIQGKARRFGFRFCHTRCAWIAWRLAEAHAFVHALEGLGYRVEHAGVWSSLPPLPPGEASAPAGPSRPRRMGRPSC